MCKQSSTTLPVHSQTLHLHIIIILLNYINAITMNQYSKSDYITHLHSYFSTAKETKHKL